MLMPGASCPCSFITVMNQNLPEYVSQYINTSDCDFRASIVRRYTIGRNTFIGINSWKVLLHRDYPVHAVAFSCSCNDTPPPRP